MGRRPEGLAPVACQDEAADRLLRARLGTSCEPTNQARKLHRADANAHVGPKGLHQPKDIRSSVDRTFAVLVSPWAVTLASSDCVLRTNPASSVKKKASEKVRS